MNLPVSICIAVAIWTLITIGVWLNASKSGNTAKVRTWRTATIVSVVVLGVFIWISVAT